MWRAEFGKNKSGQDPKTHYMRRAVFSARYSARGIPRGNLAKNNRAKTRKPIICGERYFPRGIPRGIWQKQIGPRPENPLYAARGIFRAVFRAEFRAEFGKKNRAQTRKPTTCGERDFRAEFGKKKKRVQTRKPTVGDHIYYRGAPIFGQRQ